MATEPRDEGECEFLALLAQIPPAALPALFEQMKAISQA